MQQTIRSNTFETNSSSIHCLTVMKGLNIDENIFQRKYIIFPYTNLDIGVCEEFATVQAKLRYLWTIRCKLDNDWSGYKEQLDEFTSMLKAIFPNTEFLEIEEPAYLEDYEYGFDEKKLYDENFIKNWIANGTGYFTTRDSNGNWELEYYIDNIRKFKNKSDFDTIFWSG